MTNTEQKILIQFLQDTIKRIFWVILTILILRTFFIESFKIPTTSMEPTLVGDPFCGDFILVNKAIYHFQEPQRWDVVVFRYPLNEQKPFVKRLIGLPGENIAIKNGNIYSNEKIVRKPTHIQKQLCHPVFEHSTQTYSDSWILENEKSVESKQIHIQTQQTCWATYTKTIQDEFEPYQDNLFYRRKTPVHNNGGNHRVGELKISFTLTHFQGEKAFAQIRNGNYRYVLEISCTNQQPSRLCQYVGEFDTPKITLENPFFLHPKQSYEIQFSNFDEMMEVWINQQKIFEYDYSLPLADAPNVSYEVGVKLGGRAGEFIFSNIDLYRDIYYQIQRYLWYGTETWQIPNHQYFMLGDNPSDSHDSREWKKFSITLQNGMSLEGDGKFFPTLRQSSYEFYDQYGFLQSIPSEEIREQPSGTTFAPYIQKHQIIGKAWFVAWPPPRIKKIR